MNILNYGLWNKVNSSIFSSAKRSYTLCCKVSVIHNKQTFLSTSQCSIQLLPGRRFMKKMDSEPTYDSFNKKAAKDRVSPTEYELIYNGTGEKYVRYLSGIIVAAAVFLPTFFIGTYVNIWYSHGQIDFKTFLEIMLLPHTTLEFIVMIPTLILLKIASYSFVSKYVLRIYKHHTKSQYIGVYINPILPWNNISCKFNKAVKLPDGKIFFVPWHKEYHRIAGHKSVVLKDRFRRPIDYDRMVGIEKTMDQ